MLDIKLPLSWLRAGPEAVVKQTTPYRVLLYTTVPSRLEKL